MEVVVQGTPEPDDLVRAQRLHMRPRPGFKVVGIGLVLLYLATVALTVEETFRTGRNPELAVVLLASGLVGVYYFRVALPRRWRRSFLQQKTLQEPAEMRIDAEGLGARSVLGQARIPWSYFRKWKSDRHVILIYQSDNFFHFIPKRFLTPDACTALEALLGQCLGPAHR